VNGSIYRGDMSLILKSFEISEAIHILPGHVFTGFVANGNKEFQRHSDVDRNEYF
jgi:hypothetical protein